MAVKLGPIGQIARTVKDIKQAEAWYGTVLGLPHLYSFGTMAFFDRGGTRLYLSQVQGDPPPESMIYFPEGRPLAILSQASRSTPQDAATRSRG